MHSLLSRFSHRSEVRAGRAEFSPLTRWRTGQSRGGERPAEAPAPKPTVDLGWDPGLLDRLQAPLTRYHD